MQARAVETSPARRSGAPDAIGGEKISADICIIGAGAGGLSLAIAAATFGRSVVLVEKNKLGGSHLNTGCIPSKALLASAKRAQALRTAPAFGIPGFEPEIDLRAVGAHVRSAVAALQPNHSAERLAALGIRVILGAARFLDKRTLLAGDYRVSARRFVVATGSSSAIPPIPGLGDIPYFTAETIFANDKRLDHLIIIGGGPVGLEMALAHRRLGSNVTVIDGERALGRQDPEFAELITTALRSEGISIREHTMIEAVEGFGGRIRLATRTEAGREILEGSHLLITAGRRPNVSDLNLEVAGIKYDERGIVVSPGLGTTNARVYAIGDVTGGTQATHAATYHAEIVLRRILFRAPAKVDAALIPSVAFTDPELAHVGLSEGDAIRRNIAIRAFRWSFHENDRAVAERTTLGHVKVITDKKGRVQGATIVGANASELIQIWALAVKERMHIGKIAAMTTPYPTLGDASRRAALGFYSDLPGKPWVRKIINLLAKLG